MSKFCSNCGTPTEDTTQFCPGCGQRQQEVMQIPTGQPSTYPAQPITSFNGSAYSAPVAPKKKKRKKKALIIGIVAGGLFLLCVIFEVISGGDPTINSVKNGNFIKYPDKTIDEAFNDFFADPTWSSYESGGDTYVKFTGECTMYGEPADATIIFEIDGDSFDVLSCVIGDETFGAYDINEALKIIYSE